MCGSPPKRWEKREVWGVGSSVFSWPKKKGSEFIIKWTSQWGAPQLKKPPGSSLRLGKKKEKISASSYHLNPHHQIRMFPSPFQEKIWISQEKELRVSRCERDERNSSVCIIDSGKEGRSSSAIVIAVVIDGGGSCYGNLRQDRTRSLLHKKTNLPDFDFVWFPERK